MARLKPPANSLTNATKDLLLNGKGSDFRIVMATRTFHVHSFLLSTRSEYFRGLFNRSEYTENQKGELDLSKDDDVDEVIMDAFLTALYTDDYDIDHLCNITHGADWAMNTLEVHLSISKLANRFLAHGVDDIIGAKLFSELTPLNSVFRQQSWHEIKDRGKHLRTDEPFMNAMLTIYKNAGQSGSKQARYLITGLLVDAMHNMKRSPAAMRCLQGDSELCAEILEEYLHGQTRLKCRYCGLIIRTDADTGSDAFVNCSCGGKVKVGSALYDWHQLMS